MDIILTYTLKIKYYTSISIFYNLYHYDCIMNYIKNIKKHLIRYCSIIPN